MELLKSCYRRESREAFTLDLNISMSEMLSWWKRVILEGQDDSTFQITEATLLLLSSESFIIGLQIINLKSSIPLSLLLHRLRNLSLKDTSEERIIGFFSIYGLRPIQLLQNWIFTTSSSTTTENGLNNQMWQSRIPLVWLCYSLIISHIMYLYHTPYIFYPSLPPKRILFSPPIFMSPPHPISACVCVSVCPITFI